MKQIGPRVGANRHEALDPTPHERGRAMSTIPTTSEASAAPPSTPARTPPVTLPPAFAAAPFHALVALRAQFAELARADGAEGRAAAVLYTALVVLTEMLATWNTAGAQHVAAVVRALFAAPERTATNAARVPMVPDAAWPGWPPQPMNDIDTVRASLTLLADWTGPLADSPAAANGPLVARTALRALGRVLASAAMVIDDDTPAAASTPQDAA